MRNEGVETDSATSVGPAQPTVTWGGDDDIADLRRRMDAIDLSVADLRTTEREAALTIGPEDATAARSAVDQAGTTHLKTRLDALDIDARSLRVDVDTIRKDLDGLAIEIEDMGQDIDAANSRISVLDLQLQDALESMRSIVGDQHIDVLYQGDGRIKLEWRDPRNYRFRLSRYDDTNMTVGVGIIHRNGINVSWTENQVSGFSTNGTMYVVAELTSSASKDPNLIPNGISFSAATSLPTDRNKYLIGEVTVSGNIIHGWREYNFGNLWDQVEVPDGNTASPAVDPVVKTLQWNDAANIHQRELELYGADNVTDKTGIPVSQYRIPLLDKDANGTGDLEWGVADGDVGGRESGTQMSIQLRDDATREILQLWEFDNPTASQALSADDRVLCRITTGPELVYINAEDLADWLDAQAGTQITVVTGLQVSSGTLQYKTRTIKVHTVGDESAWADLAGIAGWDLDNPTEPAVLVWDSAGGVHWAESNAQRQIWQHTTGDTVAAQYMEGH